MYMESGVEWVCDLQCELLFSKPYSLVLAAVLVYTPNFGFNSHSFSSNISHSVLLVYAMLFQSSCNNGYAEVGRWSVVNIAIWIEVSGNSPMLLML